MAFLPTIVQGSSLELSSVPEEQLKKVCLGDLVTVNGVPLKVDQISLKNGTVSLFIPDEIFTKIAFRGISKVEFSSKVERILDDLRRGRPVIYQDHLFIGAEFITQELYELFTGIGPMCIIMTELRAMRLSVKDELSSESIKMLASKEAGKGEIPQDLDLLIAEYGDLKLSDGPAEGMITLCKLAGITQVGVGVKIQGETQFPRVTSEEIKEYLKNRQPELYEVLSFCNLETEYGPWKFFCFESGDHDPHIVLIAGDIFTDEPVLTRVHSECYTGDVLHSKHCDCGEQLQRSLRLIQEHGRGIMIIPSGHEGRCIGLSNKVLAYRLQQKYKLGTYEANLKLGFPEDGRDFRPVRRILQEIGVSKIRLMTGNPQKTGDLKELISEIVPLNCASNEVNHRYLADKHQHHKKIREFSA